MILNSREMKMKKYFIKHRMLLSILVGSAHRDHDSAPGLNRLQNHYV